MAVSFISDQVVTTSADSGSTSISVPSDCDFVAMGVGAWTGGARVLMPMTTLSINGVNSTSLQSSNDSNFNKIDLRRLLAPAVGSQTLAWDFGGTGTIAEGALIFLAYFKGVDQTSPIIGSGKASGAGDVTGLGTAGADDMMCGFSVSFDTAVTVTGSSQTSLSTPARFNSCYLRGARKAAANAYDISGGDANNYHAAMLIRAAAAAAAHPKFHAQFIG